jgi:hypothetical protein
MTIIPGDTHLKPESRFLAAIAGSGRAYPRYGGDTPALIMCAACLASDRLPTPPPGEQ